ncbi:hypothetical protein FTUN_2578 [Frigoriglobus tundricola]|uniref:Uncharacterized protein n=1 Tax=Frigoriglobus tundricola TaxID=2774151 RepID=A0A6M5YQ08_9BACT|nr:hypothetical protein FTUN_2578 [Frigoriglobus tundricola]
MAAPAGWAISMIPPDEPPETRKADPTSESAFARTSLSGSTAARFETGGTDGLGSTARGDDTARFAPLRLHPDHELIGAPGP